MGSCCGGNQPQPPNPIVTAAAQTGSNVSTGVANSILNNVNQYTPQGNLEYQIGHTYPWRDPSTGVSYDIPVWKATQTLPTWQTAQDPQGWSIENLQHASQYNLGQAGKTGSFNIMNMLNQQPIDPNASPFAPGDPNAIRLPDALRDYANVGGAQRSLGDYGQQKMRLDPISGLPIQGTFADVGSQQYGFADAGGQQGQFGAAGDITRGYGPADDFSSDRTRVEGALYERLQPQLERDRANLEQRLADQGIRYGSAAYNQAMDDYNRQSTDARLAVTAAGGAEQQRMMDMAAKEAGFQNAAQQQQFEQMRARGAFANEAQAEQYKQELGRGQFANQAQMQAYTQALGRGTFANAAQEQAFKEALESGKFENAAQAQQFMEQLQAGQFGNAAQAQDYQQEALRAQFSNQGLAQTMAQRQAAFDAAQAARTANLNETYAARNQRFNEINALLSGSQVAQPNFVSTGQNRIANTDIAGLINTNFNQNLANYQQNSQNFNQLMGGIFGGLAGMIRSDRDVKENIHKVGSVFAAGPQKEGELPVYEYSYKDDPGSTRHVGPMAQDVERFDRKAVRSIDGVKHINLPRMGSILKAA